MKFQIIYSHVNVKINNEVTDTYIFFTKTQVHEFD